MKTEVLLVSDDPANQIFLLQHYEERIEKLSQQDKLSKFSMDAGLLSVVENGQYFMTKTLEISHILIQWIVMNTLFQEMMDHHNRKDGFSETPKLGPYWKLQPVICTVNMELRSELCL